MRIREYLRLGAALVIVMGCGWAWGADTNEQGEAALEAGKFAEAVKLFRASLKENRRDDAALYGMARAQEGLDRSDLAVGYYQAALAVNADGKLTVQRRKILHGAKRKLKTLDVVGPGIADRQETLTRELEKLVRVAGRKDDYEAAGRMYAMLSRINPQNREFADAYYKMGALIARGPAPDPPGGYKSLFNGLDFEGWQIDSGRMFVQEGVVVVEGWGVLVYPERYYDFRLRLKYRTALPRRAGARGHELVVHRDPEHPSIGARIQLVGPNTGMITGVRPTTRYTWGEGERMHLARPSPFKENEWMELAVSVKKHAIKVKLNDKTVFETAKNSVVGDSEGRPSRDFPGQLVLHCRSSRIEIRSLFFKGGKKAK